MWRGGSRKACSAALLALSAGWLAAWAATAPPPDADSVMTRVSQRVADYYRRAQNVVWAESSTVQPIQWNWTPDGFARTVESELRVEWAANAVLPQPTLIRKIRSINGRAPHDRDTKDRSGCTDPDAASPDPLSFLLDARRSGYQFLSIANGKEQDRPAFIINFRSADRSSKPELIEDPRGHDDCFDWRGPVATSGRIWVDADTFDVLRIDRHNTGPVDVRVPFRFQRRYRLPPWIVVDRDDLTMRYRRVAFSDPEEVMLLPESFNTLTVLRSGLQSTRRTEMFNGYRRFLTEGRIVKGR